MKPARSGCGELPLEGWAAQLDKAAAVAGGLNAQIADEKSFSKRCPAKTVPDNTTSRVTGLSKPARLGVSDGPCASRDHWNSNANTGCANYLADTMLPPRYFESYREVG
jgi:hypothetical protein